MKGISDPKQVGTCLCRYTGRFFIAAGLFLFLVLSLFGLGEATSSHVYAAISFPSLNGFSSSPSLGPAGTVITVTGSHLANGTKLQLGYTLDFRSCQIASDSQAGSVTNGNFAGWFRWPANTATGNFGVCVVMGGRQSFAIGAFQVLSSSPPQVSLSPTVPNAGTQIIVKGANFLPQGTKVGLTWQAANGSQNFSLGTVSSDKNGAFSQDFIVPSHTSSGSYIVTASSGGGQPPTLSASTTFHVDGITIVPVATPVKTPRPTVTPVRSPTVIATTTVAVAAPTGHQPTTGGNTGASTPRSLTANTHLLLFLVLAGVLLIVIALFAGIFVVYKQRILLAAAHSAQPPRISWAPTLALVTGRLPAIGPVSGASTLPLIGRQEKRDVPVRPVPVNAPVEAEQEPVLFDAALAEAIREAQMSLFVLPRPPVDEALPS